MASFAVGGVAPVVALERTQHLSGTLDYGGPIDTLPRRNVVYGNSEGDLVGAQGDVVPPPSEKPPVAAPPGKVAPTVAAPVTSASGPGAGNKQFQPDGTPTGTTPGANTRQPSSMLPATGLRDPASINAAAGDSTTFWGNNNENKPKVMPSVQTIGYDPVAHAAAVKAGQSYSYSGPVSSMPNPNPGQPFITEKSSPADIAAARAQGDAQQQKIIAGPGLRGDPGSQQYQSDLAAQGARAGRMSGDA